jgi:hypothetical protein
MNRLPGFGSQRASFSTKALKHGDFCGEHDAPRSDDKAFPISFGIAFNKMYVGHIAARNHLDRPDLGSILKRNLVQVPGRVLRY